MSRSGVEHQGLLAAGRDSDDMLPALSRLTLALDMAWLPSCRGEESFANFLGAACTQLVFIRFGLCLHWEKAHTTLVRCVCACVHTPPPPAVYSACGLNFESHAADYGHVHKCRNFKCRKYQETWYRSLRRAGLIAHGIRLAGLHYVLHDQLVQDLSLLLFLLELLLLLSTKRLQFLFIVLQRTLQQLLYGRVRGAWSQASFSYFQRLKEINTLL